MADNKSKRGGPDRQQVASEEPYEVAYFARARHQSRPRGNAHPEVWKRPRQTRRRGGEAEEASQRNSAQVGRAFRLQPGGAAARSIWRIPTLADDALEAEPARRRNTAGPSSSGASLIIRYPSAAASTWRRSCRRQSSGRPRRSSPLSRISRRPQAAPSGSAAVSAGRGRGGEPRQAHCPQCNLLGSVKTPVRDFSN